MSYTLSKTIQTQTQIDDRLQRAHGWIFFFEGKEEKNKQTEELFGFLLCQGWIETLELVQ